MLTFSTLTSSSAVSSTPLPYDPLDLSECLIYLTTFALGELGVVIDLPAPAPLIRCDAIVCLFFKLNIALRSRKLCINCLLNWLQTTLYGGYSYLSPILCYIEE